MEILIVGSDSQKEAQQKLGSAHQYRLAGNHREARAFLKTSEVIFDFIIVNDPVSTGIYKDLSAPVFFNTSFTSLKQLGITDPNIFGFCGMRTFFDREVMEVSLAGDNQALVLEKICARLNTKFAVVADQVGFVTPRVICMIINEAFYTLEEGTATRNDIDLAMKLGTNYPYGPFEWCERIGSENVCALLDAVYNDSKDDRYKVCPALRLLHSN